MICLTFGNGASLALPQRVNLSLEIGTIVCFFVILHTQIQLRTTTRSDLKTLDFKLSFRFPLTKG